MDQLPFFEVSIMGQSEQDSCNFLLGLELITGSERHKKGI